MRILKIQYVYTISQIMEEVSTSFSNEYFVEVLNVHAFYVPVKYHLKVTHLDAPEGKILSTKLL
jgi:hypothetical protein